MSDKKDQNQSSFLINDEIEVSEDDKFYYFEGYAATDQVSGSFMRHTKAALIKFAEKADEGLPVLAQHQRGAPIGRSYYGRYDENKGAVHVKFRVQKGLKLANQEGFADTDSYGKAAKEGTIDGLSGGYYINEQECDHCDATMEMYNLGPFRFIEDKNGHYPGKKIYLDRRGKEYSKKGPGREEKVIVGRNLDIDPREFSIVDDPNIPGSNIIQQVKEAWDSGLLEQKHLDQLSHRYAFDFNSGILPQPINKTDRGVNMTVEELQKQIEDKDHLIQTQKTSIDQHESEIDGYKAQVIDLEKKVEELQPFEDEANELREERDNLQNKVDEYEQDEYKSEQFERMYNDVVEEAIYYYDRTADYTPDQVRKEHDRLKNLKNYNTLTGYRDEYKNQWARRYRNNQNLQNASKKDSGIDYDRLRQKNKIEQEINK